MSQQHVDQQIPQDEQQVLTPEQQRELDEQAFSQALDEAFGDGHGEGDQQAETQQEDLEGPQGTLDTSQVTPAEQAPPAPPAAPTEARPMSPRFLAPPDMADQQPLPPEPLPPSSPQSQAQPLPSEPQPEAPKRLEVVPEELAGDIEELRRRNPAAADLAMEDSKDGEAVRARIVDGGHLAAEDRAELIMQRRNAEASRVAQQTREAAEHQRVIDQHNAHFRDVIRQELPDYFALCNDPARKAEFAQYHQDILEWIDSKPHREGKALQKIAESSRDPREICTLIRNFERDRAAAKQASKKPDPTAALAVPGRGAPVAPTGVGDRDDFDAGLDAALSSYR